MKKSLLTLLGAGLLLTSCQSDEPFAPGEGGEKQVTFTLTAPDAVGTRANGAAGSDQGGIANNPGETIYYSLELYYQGEKQGETMTTTATGKQATFSPTVILGRNYEVVAYANLKGVQNDLKNITVATGINDEKNDAYFATVPVKFTEDDLSEEITLKRPFGKLRLVATDYDANKTAITNIEVTYAEPHQNIFDAQAAAGTGVYGVFSSNNTTVTYTATHNPGYYDDATGKTIFVDYIAAPAENETSVKFNITVDYATGGESFTRTFTQDIPVRRNALTTLKGNFFTAGAQITVNVEDNFDNFIPGKCNAEKQLRMAAIMGGSYTLPCDVTLSKPLKVEADMTLNLNGKTITAANAKGDGAVIEVAEGVSAKLVGGTIKSTKYNGDAAINNAGELVLENITIEGAPLADGGYSAYAVVSSGKLTIGEGVNVSADCGCLKFSGAGETVINGGNFKNNDIGSRTLTSHVVDVEDGGTGGTHKLTINGGTFAHLHATTSGGVVICNRTTGTVYVNGGNFRGGNYYGNNNLYDYGYGGKFVVTGGTYDAKPANNYIAAGYKALKVDNLYYVLSEAIANAAGTANVTSVTE